MTYKEFLEIAKSNISEIYELDKDLLLNNTYNTYRNGFGYYLCSRDWNLGSTESFESGESIVIDPEPPPNFEDFDNLIELFYPNISVLQYRKLYNKTVITQVLKSNKAVYICDLEKVFDILLSYKSF